MRLAFFGTPDFAVPCLEALLRSNDEIACIVTQPDKPKGRGQELEPPAVKKAALLLAPSIPILQPPSVRKPPFAPELAKFAPDLAVVVAYGKILPVDLLTTPRLGCINVHGSLLPRWRGAAPIQWAVLAGDKFSGVTTMQLDEGMDTGDMLLKREVPLAEDETAGSLFERLAPVGADLLIETIDKLKKGSIKPTPQNHAAATHARMLEKDDGRIDWTQTAVEIDRKVRGMSPWPGAFTTADGKLLKVHRVRLEHRHSKPPHPAGSIFAGKPNEMHVACGQGVIVLVEVQLEGAKRMPAEEFARGKGAKLTTLGATR